jgi:hypothetical protein
MQWERPAKAATLSKDRLMLEEIRAFVANVLSSTPIFKKIS